MYHICLTCLKVAAVVLPAVLSNRVSCFHHKVGYHGYGHAILLTLWYSQDGPVKGLYDFLPCGLKSTLM